MRPFSTLVCCTVFALLGACGGLGNPGPRHVLILGDSISIGYTKTVQEILGPDFKVVRPMHKDGKRMENCAGTTNGVSAIDRWLALDGGDWDVIHFNFGLHDIKRVNPKTRKNSNDPNHPNQADLTTYCDQLTRITDRLNTTGAQLVFATTTPVPQGALRPHRDPSDVPLYNAAACNIMKSAGIAIDGLYAYALPQLSEIQKPANVHFTNEGSKALAEQVAKAIQATTRP